MFFTNIGRVIAWLLFGLAVFKVSIGFLIAFTAEDPVGAAQRYLGKANTGAAIDEGVYGIGVAIALGILTEISRNVSKETQSENSPNERS